MPFGITYFWYRSKVRGAVTDTSNDRTEPGSAPRQRQATVLPLALRG